MLSFIITQVKIEFIEFSLNVYTLDMGVFVSSTGEKRQKSLVSRRVIVRAVSFEVKVNEVLGDWSRLEGGIPGNTRRTELEVGSLERKTEVYEVGETRVRTAKRLRDVVAVTFDTRCPSLVRRVP